MNWPKRGYLLLILALVLESCWIINLGECSCCGWGYSSCPVDATIQQHMWDKEIYNFLYSDECYRTFTPHEDMMPAPVPASNKTLDGAASYWLDNGNRLYLGGSYEEAESSYAEAVKLDPTLLQGWINMGNALFFMGRYQESLDAYNAVLEQAPQNENALQGKSRTLLTLNRTSQSNATSVGA
jgi:tetratricopeptide (TPR) repeat protein